ncbi:capsular polysaccharide biosynthesis protein [Frigidibacter sp. RF13]|uniref:capsular polysaccharide biosynthesis protein n=1 Tax=Frigidibacter sp. RF13 TaxID=2997340 RepID=UPI00226E5524|nr:capsular polysaccharide biosynthesis protein [Frigidibacter sp. RF13]MCY1126044.1 capsular polysaccharide biosynthesis protein [Frigidibacter sp. RF13]
MSGAPTPDAADRDSARRLFVYSGGFLTQTRIRRILALKAWDVRLGAPLRADDHVGVWGKSPTSPRGEVVAGAFDRPVLRVEDPFLRSVKLGRDGAAPIGLLLDERGVHFAADVPSDLEVLLATHPLDDSHLLGRARAGMARIAAGHLSKYNLADPTTPPPAPGYVLVIDQTKGDASITHGGATAATFREMLFVAMDEHPGRPILIRSHPETGAGHRPGHFGPEDRSMGPIEFADPALTPQALFEGAVAVYTVSSQMGFEAILAGHKPHVLGQPFYAGWGLTDDRQPVWRRQRKLTRAQLFAAAMILYPVWYDPCRDRLCSFEEMLGQLEAEVRAFREDRVGYVATGMRLWKRAHLQKFYGREKPVLFREGAQAVEAARSSGRRLLAWGTTGPDTHTLDGTPVIRRVEDGLLRSRGLGADLVPPLSLIADGRGIYYDPSQESDLDRLIAAPALAGEEDRARRLIAAITRAGLSKYNIGGALPPLPAGRRILVVGQVEDDASVRLGAGEVKTNLGLLDRAQAENPGAVIVYKPHPDVEAGLRPGLFPPADLTARGALLVHAADPAALLLEVDEVWTITSTLGFEAMMRGKPVTCLGAPFYAGWGLTRDLGPAVPHRKARPTLEKLVHAALIAYPRYRDPVTGLPCPAEVIVDRLAKGEVPRPGAGYRFLSKLQGLLASRSRLWR